MENLTPEQIPSAVVKVLAELIGAGITAIPLILAIVGPANKFWESFFTPMCFSPVVGIPVLLIGAAMTTSRKK